MPSPAIATSRPSAWWVRISSSFCSGVASGRKSSTPDSSAIFAAVRRLSPVTITVLIPIRAQLVEAGLHSLLDDVLEVDDAEDVVVAADRERRAALAADQVELFLQLGRRPAALCFDELDDRVAGALSVFVAVDVDAAHPGFGGEGDEMRLVRL